MSGHLSDITALLRWKAFVVSASIDTTVRVWKKGASKLVLKGHSDVVACIADWGEFLASGSWDRSIRISNHPSSYVCLSTRHIISTYARGGRGREKKNASKET
jgi:WD40 repeat protein